MLLNARKTADKITLTTLNKFVDGMDTNIDRVKLQKLFAELYTEAQHLEV